MQHPEKPKNSGWTEAQWEAVSVSGNNLLVSAAAGSGKTAVLVERIIHIITDPSRNIDVDQLLVVTFTKAAAAEMKNRISAALVREINKHPGSLHLQRQLSLVNRAQISTLHAFCMTVIRKYYYKIEIDPQFRILDETEGELMREEILEEVLEERYSRQNNDNFLEAAERFSGDRSDEGLRQVLRSLFRFSRSHPDPGEWLQRVASAYQLAPDSPLENTQWGKEVWKDAKLRIKAALQKVEQAASICLDPDGPHPYLKNMEEDQLILQYLQEAPDWGSLYERFQSLTFGKLQSIKKKDHVDEALQERVKNLRDTVKKEITALQTEAFHQEPSLLLQDIRDMADSIGVLAETVEIFSKRYQAAKEEKGVVDFSDLEHFCLAILNAEGSEAAAEYRRRFAEIMVDEYQDTNHAQEAILQTISRKENLFLVGDVKQSVYRFRLADPGLFLDKFRKYNRTEGIPGWLIHLDKNFRSRKEIIQAANFIFRQLMDDSTGEITYDKTAELKTGSDIYPDTIQGPELILINKGAPLAGDPGENEEMDELETAQLEARWTAQKIKQLIHDKYQVLDKETNQMRQITFRDITILMRSMTWASTFMEECKKEGLPVYAELSGGYFEAVEINIMLSLLKVIDNPRQDIPLAAVLRSPIVGMNEEELAAIRTMDKHGSFYDAFKAAAISDAAASWQEKSFYFFGKLKAWRERARSEALSEFIWDLLQETGYYDFAGGLPGGKQRQANLLALYDRARTYEKTSFRGLFRFLRFVERIQERGDDLGTARALGEQEDVIRLMTIHKSKGLEFPVVFLAGMNKMFNFQDLNHHVLLHKDLGLGSKYIDPSHRVVKESIPHLALKVRNHKESIAEEMRILYVAMTRAKEKLFMVGTLSKAEKKLEEWASFYEHTEWVLPEWNRRKAKSFLDWVGPAVFRHKAARAWHPENKAAGHPRVHEDAAPWQIQVVEHAELKEGEEEETENNEQTEQELINRDIIELASGRFDNISERMSWQYPYDQAVQTRSKQTVSEYKRTLQDEYSESVYQPSFRSQYAQRPLFMQETLAKPEEKGTALHTFMEHLPLDQKITASVCEAFAFELVEKELLTEEQAEMIDTAEVAAFFQSPVGERMKKAVQVYREIPFSYGKRDNPEQDIVILQGAVDCIFQEKDHSLVLIDYKTDAFLSRFPDDSGKAVSMMKERYQTQIDLYREAISSIWNREIQEAYIYAFDGRFCIDMIN
ncbi:helicase-exonuclease AddAB subunit AddA [Salibacterium aidingense]|uniref:helicase-exonuclease AddAB subunit AddA n=1 Tax=Salibacterium aidingense TaxID=384933 RepID=UPI000405B50F|nr:helicase-exonuclease AddAB subunit AddA [Salibacterium aidingense]